jgi:hypothetical protein
MVTGGGMSNRWRSKSMQREMGLVNVIRTFIIDHNP